MYLQSVVYACIGIQSQLFFFLVVLTNGKAVLNFCFVVGSPYRDTCHAWICWQGRMGWIILEAKLACTCDMSHIMDKNAKPMSKPTRRLYRCRLGFAPIRNQ